MALSSSSFPDAIRRSPGHTPRSPASKDVQHLDFLVKQPFVLLVDDNPDLLEIASTLFEFHGCNVLTARTGDEAFDIIRQRDDIDVLFSDVVMPGMNGLELGRLTRELRPEVRIILVSGYVANVGGLEHLLDFDFLLKPYRFSDIRRLLDEPR